MFVTNASERWYYVSLQPLSESCWGFFFYFSHFLNTKKGDERARDAKALTTNENETDHPIC